MIGAILPILFELIMYTPIQWPYKYLIKVKLQYLFSGISYSHGCNTIEQWYSELTANGVTECANSKLTHSSHINCLTEFLK